jgi:hypothetical protein
VRERLIDAYDDRPIWLIDGPTVTGEGFRVADGPLSADALRARSASADVEDP